MQRRRFIKKTLITSTGLILFPSFVKAGLTGEERQDISELEKYFIDPPSSAKPWVFWQWMNGHITKEGITLDLEAMKRMGIGGVINFNKAHEKTDPLLGSGLLGPVKLITAIEKII